MADLWRIPGHQGQFILRLRWSLGRVSVKITPSPVDRLLTPMAREVTLGMTGVQS